MSSVSSTSNISLNELEAQEQNKPLIGALETYEKCQAQTEKICDFAEVTLTAVPIGTGVLYMSPAGPFVCLILVAILALVAAILGEQNGGGRTTSHTSGDFQWVKTAENAASVVTDNSLDQDKQVAEAGMGLIAGTIWLGKEMAVKIYTLPVLKGALAANGSALALGLGVRGARTLINRHYNRKIQEIKDNHRTEFRVKNL